MTEQIIKDQAWIDGNNLVQDEIVYIWSGDIGGEGSEILEMRERTITLISDFWNTNLNKAGKKFTPPTPETIGTDYGYYYLENDWDETDPEKEEEGKIHIQKGEKYFFWLYDKTVDFNPYTGEVITEVARIGCPRPKPEFIDVHFGKYDPENEPTPPSTIVGEYMTYWWNKFKTARDNYWKNGVIQPQTIPLDKIKIEYFNPKSIKTAGGGGGDDYAYIEEEPAPQFHGDITGLFTYGAGGDMTNLLGLFE